MRKFEPFDTGCRLQLPRSMCERIDRRTPGGIRRGGRVSAGKKKDPLLYGITSFSAAAFYQSAIGGGEPGIASGFGAIALVRWHEIPTGSQMVAQRVNGSATAGWYIQTSGAAVRAICVSGAGSPVISATYTLAPSDVGRVMLVEACLDGAGMLWLGVNGVIAGAGVAITGYTPAESQPMRFGIWETTQGFVSGCLLSFAAWRGTLSVAQRRAYADAARMLGDLPTTIQGGTVSHRESVRDQLRGTVVTSGQTGPAQLDDTITRAAADALVRQGSPTVVTIDPSRDGRRTLGVLGTFSETSYLEAVGGVPGAAGGFALQVICLFRSGQASQTRVFLSCCDDPITSGWNAFTTGTNASLYFSIQNAGGLNLNIGPFAIPTSALDRHVLVQLRYTGTVFELSFDGAVVATLTASYRPVASSILTRVGRDRRAGLGQAGSAIEVYGLSGGNGNASAADMTAAYTETMRTGRLARLAIDQHYWWFGDDIVAAGETVPAQLRDQIGTDHFARVGGVSKQDASSVWFDGGAWYQMAASGVTASLPWVAAKIRVRTLSAPAGSRYLLAKANGSDAGVEMRFNSPTTVQFLAADGAGNRQGMSVTLDASDVGVVRTIVGRLDGTGVRRIYIRDRATMAASAPFTGYTTSTAPLTFGSLGGGSTLTGADFIGAAVGSGELTDAELDALLADNDPSTAPNVPGKTERRLYFGPGAASDAPPVVTDLAGSGEKATLVGAGLQVAQRTERIWSYETSPITTAVSCPTTADFWETAAPILPGDTAGFWAASGFLLTSQSVPTSAGRHLLSSILSGPARGWYQAFAGTNASLQCGAASAANTFVPSTTTFAAADVGKLFLLFIVYDAVAGRVRSFIRRAEVGTGAVISGYAPSGGIIRITNGVLSASPGEGFAVLGFMCGLGIPTLSEIQSSTDAFLASDGDFAKSLIANKTSYAMQFRGLTAVPNEIAPIVGTIPMVRNGSPTLVPQYARAAGW